MAQSTPYTRLSELLSQVQERLADVSFKCVHALSYIEEALQTIDAMNNAERETAMKLLTSWMIAEKFGPHARPVMQGLQRYSIAECLFEDPDWKPPVFAGDFPDDSASLR